MLFKTKQPIWGRASRLCSLGCLFCQGWKYGLKYDGYIGIVESKMETIGIIGIIEGLYRSYKDLSGYIEGIKYMYIYIYVGIPDLRAPTRGPWFQPWIFGEY